MPSFKASATVVCCAAIAIGIANKLISDDDPIATVNAIALNLHTTPDARPSSRMQVVLNGRRQAVTLPRGTRVRIIQTQENGWDKMRVEEMGDTGKPPAHELIGFVNATLLTVAASNPPPAQLPQTSPAPADRNTPAQPAADADTELPDIGVSCGEKGWGDPFCVLTSRDSRTLIINEVVLNQRSGVEPCDTREPGIITTADALARIGAANKAPAKLSDKPLRLGDTVSVSFSKASCGSPVIIDIYTNIGSVDYTLR